MADRAAASAGVVLAGLALAASVPRWTADPFVPDLPLGSPVAAAFALAALVAFLARRHGAVDRRPGAAAAGLLAALVVVVAFARVVAPALGGGSSRIGVALPAAALAGTFAVVAAAADWQGTPRQQLVTRTSGVLSAALVGVLAFLVSNVVALVPLLVVGDLGMTLRVVVTTVGFGVGLAAFAVAYLAAREYDLDYLDLDVPTLRDAGYAVGGVVVLFVLLAGVSFLFRALGLPSARSGIEEAARGMENPEFLLALVPLSWLVIGPGEELVYRNIVQKGLYETFSKRWAVVVASVLFAVIHIPQYFTTDPIALFNTLAVIFALALVLGYTYLRTENLLVPVFIHGTFNALQFLGLYAQLAGLRFG